MLATIHDYTLTSAQHAAHNPKFKDGIIQISLVVALELIKRTHPYGGSWAATKK